MRNSKHKLLPYEVIEKAVAGEPEAVHKVDRHYTGYIKYLSFFQGRYNDDLQEQLEAHLIGALFRFRFAIEQARERKRINRLHPQTSME